MCDCPAGVITTHETHKSWIIFKENTTHIGSTNTVQTGVQTTTVPDGQTQSDPNLDNIYLLLDPHLRPSTPDFEDANSVGIFEEHKQLAQEYLKIQTELAYLSQKKKKLQENQTIEQQRGRERIEQLQSEKEALVLLKESLEKQKELLSANMPRQQGDGWVLVPRHQSEL